MATDPKNGTTGSNVTGSSSTLTLQSPAFWVGLLVLIGFAGLVAWTLGVRGDTNWDRVVYIFGSVEAIAFAAAGAIFGTQVQRQQVQAAQAQASAERTRANEAQSTVQQHVAKAAQAKALAVAVKRATESPAGDVGGETVAPSALAHLAAIADQILAS